MFLNRDFPFFPDYRVNLDIPGDNGGNKPYKKMNKHAALYGRHLQFLNHNTINHTKINSRIFHIPKNSTISPVMI
jgi:hypothetical protein